MNRRYQRRRVRGSSSCSNRRLRLGFEQLETRWMLATFVVNSVANIRDSGDFPSVCDTALRIEPPRPASGICTLVAAISSANANPGPDTIEFNVPGPGVPRFDLLSSMSFSERVIVDGTTQPGSNTVEIRSPTTGFNFVEGSSGSTIRGMTINSDRIGIELYSDDNIVVGNRFGINPEGTMAMPSSSKAIAILGSRNRIGGDTPQERNLIAVGIVGVNIFSLTDESAATGNIVRGNYIGTTVDGTGVFRNSGVGVGVAFSPNTTIENNIISGNLVGISVGGIGSTGTLVSNNFIGTDPTGNVTNPDGQPRNGDELGNGKGILVNDAPGVEIVNNVIAGSIGSGTTLGYGIHLANQNASGAKIKGNKIGVNAAGSARLGNASAGIFVEAASQIIIGGPLSSDRNIISANGGDGITIVGTTSGEAKNNKILGNYIGVDATGSIDLGNRFRGVHIDQLTSETEVGGSTLATRNVISGNDSDGVIIALPTAMKNKVMANYIGTDKTGLLAIPNERNGVFVLNSPDNEIGGSGDEEGNLISANKLAGVRIEGVDTKNNFVRNNRIGTDLNGQMPLGNLGAGVHIVDATLNHIGGQRSQDSFVVGNTISANEHGVHIQGTLAVENAVVGNKIGTNNDADIIDPDGNPNNGIGLGNRQTGILIDNAARNRIGLGFSELVMPANVISGNNTGVLLRGASATSNLVGNNLIGTNRLGRLPLGNRDAGVVIDGAKDNLVGGFKTGLPLVPGNTISGNGNGVLVLAGATGNVIGANKIGTNSEGGTSQPPSLLGNAGFGISVDSSSGNFVGQATVIGVACDADKYPPNTIAGNGQSGVLIKGNAAQKNSVLCNSIFSNSGIGIDLNEDGVTPNDPRDEDGADGQANKLQNFPILSILERVEANVSVAGSFSGEASKPYRIDFFATDVGQARVFEHGVQGQRHIGTITVTTDATGYVNFRTAAGQLAPTTAEEVITATAADAEGNTSEFSHPTPDFKAGAKDIRTPVLFVPGFFASFVPSGPGVVNDGNYIDFLLKLGIHPQYLVKDPILKSYDDIVKTLVAAGYEEGRDLFVAPFDWRLSLGPADAFTTRDGLIEGVVAERSGPNDTRPQITDANFEFGIDYLGYWLKQAAEDWYSTHGHALTNVHLIAHSMGGVLSRTYIQSTAYGGSFTSTVRSNGKLALPMVGNLTMLGTPNRGAAVTFPAWEDNFAGDISYQLVLSKMISHAWYKLRAGIAIDGGFRNTIAPSDIDFNASDLHAEKVKFLRKYLKGLGNLLPEYPNYAENFNEELLPDFENHLLVDLNTNVLSTKRAARTIAMYGTSVTTHTFARSNTGPNPLPSLVSFTDSTHSFPGIFQVWYSDTDVDNNGDGTVPLPSLEGLFVNDAAVEIFSYCNGGGCRGKDIVTSGKVNHTSVVSNIAVQERILRHLGHPLAPSKIFTGSEVGTDSTVPNTVYPFLLVNLLNDPSDAILVDNRGRRLGFTTSTGVLAEIPGSVYFGQADGIGWIFDTAVEGPLELRLTGRGEDHVVQVSNYFGGVFSGVEDSGRLSSGVNKTVSIPPIFKNATGVNEIRLTGVGQSLDLRNINTQQLNLLSAVDIKGTGPNTLLLNDRAVSQAAGGSLSVSANSDDKVDIAGQWDLASTTTRDELFYRVLQGTGRQLLLNGPSDWRNPLSQFDVNASESVEPLDVLLVINLLNFSSINGILDKSNRLQEARSVQPFPNIYPDTNGDGFVTAIDALFIINFLNVRATGEGETRATLIHNDTLAPVLREFPHEVQDLHQYYLSRKSTALFPSVAISEVNLQSSPNTIENSGHRVSAFDSSEDRFVTPLDALMIINFLNRKVSAEGEPALLVDRDAAFADMGCLELELDERPQFFKRGKRAKS